MRITAVNGNIYECTLGGTKLQSLQKAKILIAEIELTPTELLCYPEPHITTCLDLREQLLTLKKAITE